MKESQRATTRAATADDKSMNDISSSRSADLTPRDDDEVEEESGEESAITESSSPFQPLGQIPITARVPTEDAVIGLSAGLSNAVSALSDDLLSAVQNFGEMIAGKQDAISAVGILKRDEESGNIVSAVLGTDYGTYSKPDGGIPTNDIALSAITEDRIADEAVGESKLKKFTAWTAVDLPEGWTLHSVSWVERHSRWDCHIKSPDGGLYGGATDSGQPADGVEARFYVYVGSAYVSDEIIFNAKRNSMIPKKTSDLTNDGDGESSFITKTRAEEGWWSRWTVLRTYNGTTADVTSQVDQPRWEEFEGGYWNVDVLPDDGEHSAGDIDTGVGENATALHWNCEAGANYTATRHLVCAPVPTKPDDIGAQPVGDYVNTADATLTPVYSQTPTFSEWTISPSGKFTEVLWLVDYWSDPQWALSFVDYPIPTYNADPDATSMTATDIDGSGTVYTATRVRTDIVGYTLGSQTDKPLQPKGDYLTAAPVQSVNGKTGAVVLEAADVGALGNTGWQLLSGQNAGLSIGDDIGERGSTTFRKNGITDYPVGGNENILEFPDASGTLALRGDLPYALVSATPTQTADSWTFSGTSAGEGYHWEVRWSGMDEYWELWKVSDSDTSSEVFQRSDGNSPTDTSLHYEYEDVNLTATRNWSASLIDRAVNVIDVSNLSTQIQLSLPKELKDKSRDFFVKFVSNAPTVQSTATFANATLVDSVGEPATVEVQPNAVYRFTETKNGSANDEPVFVVTGANMQLDIDGKVNRTGDTMTGDLKVLTHAQIGNGVDFTTGGPENFAVGHDHKFFGKESFAVHDGNRIGAKGWYWKAIDTTEHKIYLTKEQIKYGNSIEPDSRCLPIVSLSDSLKISTHPEYDVPYFGPKANSAHQELFAAEEGIGIGLTGGSLVGKYITIVNMWHDLYVRCFKVEAVDSTGSVITYSEVKQLSTYDAERTFYRKTVAVGNTISYHDNQYVIFFPELDQSLVVGNHYVTATSFGCTALGDANHVMGYNSFATGFQNRAEGNYSVAIGSYNTAAGVDSVAIGQKAIASKNFDFVWNGNVDSVSHYTSHGKSTFNINPKPVSGNDPFTGFYIGEESLASRLSAFMTSTDVNALIERINVLEDQVRQLSAYHANGQ